MSTLSGNRGPMGESVRTTHFCWDEFDALPRVMRDLINYAPTSVGTGYVIGQLRAGIYVEYVARLAVQRWRSYARRAALTLYGADHPQAA